MIRRSLASTQGGERLSGLVASRAVGEERSSREEIRLCQPLDQRMHALPARAASPHHEAHTHELRRGQAREGTMSEKRRGREKRKAAKSES